MLQFDEYKVKLNNIRPALDELDQGRRSMSALPERVNVLEIPAEELSAFSVSRILTNVNDPGEYRKVMESL